MIAAMEKNHACMIPNPFGRFKHRHKFCAKMGSFREIVGVKSWSWRVELESGVVIAV